MTDLRTKLARAASEWRQRYKVGNLGVHVEAPDLMLADAILSLPELRETLEALSAWRDVQNLGTGFMKDGKRIDPADVYLPPSD